MLHHPYTDTFVILMYHQVTDAQRNAFIRQMAVLKRMALPVSLDGYPLEKKGRLFVAVTFDDAFRSLLRNAVPELIRLHIPFTIFVPTGYCGKMQGWPVMRRFGSDLILSIDELKSIPRELLSIGAHTVMHENLALLDRESAEKEIIESKRFLEENLNISVTHFAFPYGYYNQDHIELLKRNGFIKAFRTIPFFCPDNTFDHFIYGRISIFPDDWKLEYTLKILGAYQWFCWYKAKMVKFKIVLFLKKVVLRLH